MCVLVCCHCLAASGRFSQSCPLLRTLAQITNQGCRSLYIVGFFYLFCLNHKHHRQVFVQDAVCGPLCVFVLRYFVSQFGCKMEAGWRRRRRRMPPWPQSASHNLLVHSTCRLQIMQKPSHRIMKRWHGLTVRVCSLCAVLGV